MGVPLFIYALFGIAMLSLCFLRTWSVIFILAVVELVWVLLCVFLGAQIQQVNDTAIFFWIFVLMFFSAVELATTTTTLVVNDGLSNTQFVKPSTTNKITRAFLCSTALFITLLCVSSLWFYITRFLCLQRFVLL